MSKDKWKRRDEKLRKEKNRMPVHGKGLFLILIEKWKRARKK